MAIKSTLDINTNIAYFHEKFIYKKFQKKKYNYEVSSGDITRTLKYSLYTCEQLVFYVNKSSDSVNPVSCSNMGRDRSLSPPGTPPSDQIGGGE